ncbi:MAG: outer membrane beta-barrel protein [Geminicoccaceae bacterium]
MSRSRLTRGLLAASAMVLPGLAVLGTTGPASAQDVGAFTPLGIRAGSFLIHPTLEADVAYDDNIFATDDNEEDDITYEFRPRVTAQSQWSRHKLDVTADADTGIFSDNSDSNYFDFGVAANGRLDVLHNSALKIGAGIRRDHEDRDDPDESGDDDVTEILISGINLAYRHTFNRVYVEPGFDFSRRDYDNTDNVKNNDRDNQRTQFRMRVGYAVSPRLSVFGEGFYGFVTYDQTPNAAGLDRESDSFGGRAGVEVELTGLLTGEASFGYSKQTYDDDQLDDIDSPSAQVALTWNPTQLTTVTGSLSGDIRETTTVVNGDPASGIIGLSAGISVQHELRRNIYLSGRVGYDRDDFDGTDRTDDTYRVGAGIRYLLNRNIGVDASYDYSTRSSDIDDQEFDRNIFRIGIVARL